MAEFDILPLFKSDTKVVTVAFRTTVIPEQDVDIWLEKYARLLKVSEEWFDEQGVWTGEYRAIVSLWKGPRGRLQHLPKYFYLGGERGVTRYGQQPSACFHCGGYNHIRRECKTVMCARCGARGHPSSRCLWLPTCNLCDGDGHLYEGCPWSATNQRSMARCEAALLRAREGWRRARRGDDDLRGWVSGARGDAEQRRPGGLL